MAPRPGEAPPSSSGTHVGTHGPPPPPPRPTDIRRFFGEAAGLGGGGGSVGGGGAAPAGRPKQAMRELSLNVLDTMPLTQAEGKEAAVRVHFRKTAEVVSALESGTPTGGDALAMQTPACPPTTAVRREPLTQRLRQGYTPTPGKPGSSAAAAAGLVPRGAAAASMLEEVLASDSAPAPRDFTLEKRRRSSSEWRPGRASAGGKRRCAENLLSMLATVEEDFMSPETATAAAAAPAPTPSPEAAPPAVHGETAHDTAAAASTGKAANGDAAAAASASAAVSTPAAEADAAGLLWRRWTVVQTSSTTDGNLELECTPTTGAPVLGRFAASGAFNAKILLRGSWADTDIEANDVVHVLARRGTDGAYTVSDDAAEMGDGDDALTDEHDLALFPGGCIVVHPDVLVSGTHVSNSLECVRRSVLERLVAERASNPSAVFGNLVHDMFQARLEHAFASSPSSSPDVDLGALLEDLVALRHDDLADVGVQPDAAKARMKDSAPSVDAFVRTYVGGSGAIGAGASVELAPRGRGTDCAEHARVRVTELVDIEENVHAPRFGLKGRIDATLRCSFHDERGGDVAAVPPPAPALIPLEVKTGKERGIPHRAQLLMYSLLVWERYGKPSSRALLWYAGGGANDQEGALRGVRLNAREIAQLLQQRNRLASGWHRYTQRQVLPPLLGDPRSCGSCFHRTPCMKYHRALERGDVRTCGAPGAFESTGALALTDAEASFVARWTGMVDAEEAEARKGCDSPWLRGASGRKDSLVNLSLVGVANTKVDGKLACDGTLTYTFASAAASSSSDDENDSPFHGDGCHVVLGTMCGQYGVAMGRARRVGPTTELVLTERLRAPATLAVEGLSWRMDTLEMLASFTRMRASLLALTEPLHTPVRRAVMFGAQETGQTPMSESPARESKQVDRLQEHLNAEQRRAVEAGLGCATYACVIGRPGMGKTHALAALAAECWRRGKKVLLASHTNAAVDNVLVRLVKAGIPVVRIGQRGSVAEGVRHRCVVSAGEYEADRRAGRKAVGIKGNVAVANMARANAIVGVTCHGCHSPLVRNRRFDVCLVDEAGQVATPLLLGAMLLADRFVLVGDPAQLPPLCVSETARQGGLGVSLFAHLCATQAHSTVELVQQYRMAPPISAFVSSAFYNGRLRDGAGVAERAAALDPSFFLDGKLAPLMFVDVEGEGAEEATRNQDEAEAIARVLADWRAGQPSGSGQASVLVLTPYRAQLEVLRGALSRAGLPASYEVRTVDAAQGKEADVVAVSCVVRTPRASRSASSPIGPLGDPFRSCVALSRARSALWVFGRAPSLSSDAVFRAFLAAAAPPRLPL